jgi:hypothetical protein
MGTLLLVIGLIVLFVISRPELVLANKVKSDLSQLPEKASLNELSVKMMQLGFTCSHRHGEFFGESGQKLSAPDFLACEWVISWLLVCNWNTNVILVPVGENGYQKHITVGNGLVCL